MLAGDGLHVTADVQLGGLGPSDVAVEVYFGRLRGEHRLSQGSVRSMQFSGELGLGKYRFECALPTPETGEHAYAVRVLPRHDALPDRFATRLLTWT